MKNALKIPLIAAISFAVSAVIAELVPSLTVPMTLISVGVAGISTLILLFSLSESRKQGRLGSTILSTMIMAAIAIALFIWLLPRVQMDVPVHHPKSTPTSFPIL